MTYKNIQVTNAEQTLIPIHYIDEYRDEKVKAIFADYKFSSNLKNCYLFTICNDICAYTILEHGDAYIIFTYPPSTMFKRGEKDIDSMGHILEKTLRDFAYYFNAETKYHFKSLFSINPNYLKHKKAQHLDGSKKARTRDLDKRYYINIFNKIYVHRLFKNKRKNIICIIDDVSSTGSTLLACQHSLKGLVEKYDIEIILFSLAH